MHAIVLVAVAVPPFVALARAGETLGAIRAASAERHGHNGAENNHSGHSDKGQRFELFAHVADILTGEFIGVPTSGAAVLQGTTNFRAIALTGT